jgi:periplasmic copper chaperone A
MMKACLFAAALLTLAGPAFADPVKAGDLTLDNAWARATPKGSQVGAGYITIRNDGAAADRLASAAADFADAQIHEMKHANGVMQMREAKDGVEIPANGTLSLAPGGYHVMFVGLKHPLAKGDTISVTLKFARAGEVKVAMPVLAVGAAGPAAGHGAHDMPGMTK